MKLWLQKNVYLGFWILAPHFAFIIFFCLHWSLLLLCSGGMPILCLHGSLLLSCIVCKWSSSLLPPTATSSAVKPNVKAGKNESSSDDDSSYDEPSKAQLIKKVRTLELLFVRGNDVQSYNLLVLGFYGLSKVILVLYYRSLLKFQGKAVVLRTKKVRKKVKRNNLPRLRRKMYRLLTQVI